MANEEISDAELRVLLAIYKEIKATPKRISELTGLSAPYVRNICRILARINYLQRLSRGLYTLSPKGENRLKGMKRVN